MRFGKLSVSCLALLIVLGGVSVRRVYSSNIKFGRPTHIGHIISSRDSRWLAALFGDGRVRIINARTKAIISQGRAPGLVRRYDRMVISPDGKLLAIGLPGKKVATWTKTARDREVWHRIADFGDEWENRLLI